MIFKSEDDIKNFQERVDSIKEEVNKGEMDSERLTNILDNILDNVKDTYEYMEAKSEALEKAAIEYEYVIDDIYEIDDLDKSDELNAYSYKVEEVIDNIKNNEYNVDELKEIKNNIYDFIEKFTRNVN